ncbi:MAG TPA: class I SAM-dependent methyltransferase, partial [Opitutaceae bacterium]
MDSRAPGGWSGAEVKASFNGIPSVLYYTRAAHFLGLWKSERLLMERFLPDRKSDLVEAGCGAGRVTLGLWRLGYRRICAFDFANELLDQARSLAVDQRAGAIVFRCADATSITRTEFDRGVGEGFSGALFMFNGLMQIPGRARRRAALAGLHRLCRPGAPLLFTTHDRDSSPTEQILWRLEAGRWERGEQD